MTEPRPEEMTREIAEKVAREIVGELIKNDHLEAAQLESLVRDVVQCARRHMDGYEIAKALDDHCWWNCNFEMAEELDSFSSMVDHEIRDAEKAWAERNNVQPPLALHTRVKWREGQDQPTGEITGVYEYGAAKYLIAVDDDANTHGPQMSRRIVNFEDVTAIDQGDPDPASADAICLGG